MKPTLERFRNFSMESSYQVEKSASLYEDQSLNRIVERRTQGEIQPRATSSVYTLSSPAVAGARTPSLKGTVFRLSLSSAPRPLHARPQRRPSPSQSTIGAGVPTPTVRICSYFSSIYRSCFAQDRRSAPRPCLSTTRTLSRARVLLSGFWFSRFYKFHRHIPGLSGVFGPRLNPFD